MKKQIILLLVGCIFYMGIYSCKERTSSAEDTQFFKEKSDVSLAGDSIATEPEFIIELNIGSDPDRGAWQNPDLVIEKLGNLNGKIVADIGSGTGYFTFPISRMAQKVLAIDIEQRYLDYIEDRKLELPIEQAEAIETRLTVEDEPNLHSGEVDAVLMVNVYYYLNEHASYMKIVNNALRENGILVLVDFKPGDLPVGPSGFKATAEEAKSTLIDAGFSEVHIDSTSLQYQYVITAK